MPIYEYQCDTCGDRFEAIQKVSEAPLSTCGDRCGRPGDGGGSVRRLMSAHHVGGSSSTGAPPCESPMGSFSSESCGRCGKVGPGCGME